MIDLHIYHVDSVSLPHFPHHPGKAGLINPHGIRNARSLGKDHHGPPVLRRLYQVAQSIRSLTVQRQHLMSADDPAVDRQHMAPNRVSGIIRVYGEKRIFNTSFTGQPECHGQPV
jgi:hypothetical protein